jgi:dihydrofolate synthase/folylpolyglutamate synthase
LNKILPLFPKQATYYFAKADVPRGLAADQLATVAIAHQLKGKAYSSMEEALDAARKEMNENDLTYVGGSIYGLAEVL